jgi:hypothetical protein
VQSEGVGEMYFRCCAFRAFFSLNGHHIEFLS